MSLSGRGVTTPTSVPPFSAEMLRLVAITDDLRDGIEGLVGRARAAERGGATMVQLRLKATDARTLVEVGNALVGALLVPVIVNDRVDVALACGAAAVLGGRGGAPGPGGRPPRR